MRKKMNPRNTLLIIAMCYSCLLSAQKNKTWTLKANDALTEESKKVFDGKKVHEGINRLAIAKGSYVNVIVKKGVLSNMIFVTSADGMTITTDLAVARSANPQADHCRAQKYLCQIQCRLGKIPDPTRNGSCLDQCEMSFGACPVLPSGSGFGGIVLQ